MFGADALFKRADARDGKRKPEPTNCLSRNLKQETEEVAL